MVRPHVLPALLVCYGLVAQTPAPAPAPAAAPTAAPENVQRLSLQEAIKTSLQNNLQVEIAKETRNANQAGLLMAQGYFDWLLTANASTGRQDFASTGQAYVGGPTNSREGTTWERRLDVGVQKPFEWGGNLQVDYNPVYRFQRGLTLDTPAVGQNTPYDSGVLNYSGSLSATYTQSLLSGFGRKATEVNVIVARKSSQIADYQFQLSIINLVASTESQYWDLVYAQRNLENAKLSLNLAQKQLNENRIRVEVGTLAPIEVTSAEAQVAQREQLIIAAEAQLLNASDAMIRALYPNVEHPDKIAPSDEPTLSHTILDEPAGEKMALDRRVELKIAQLGLESSSAQRAAAESRRKPKLDAFATYTTNSNTYDRLGPVNTDLTSSKYPGYVIGLNFSLPITNRSARGTLNQARANERGSELSLKDQELGILLQVRQAFRNVDASEKGVEAAKKTRVFREKDLDAEQKKFENGMSTNFLVLSKQNDLDTARSSELQAQISYAKAVTALEQAMGNLLEARNLAFPK